MWYYNIFFSLFQVITAFSKESRYIIFQIMRYHFSNYFLTKILKHDIMHIERGKGVSEETLGRLCLFLYLEVEKNVCYTDLCTP